MTTMHEFIDKEVKTNSGGAVHERHSAISRNAAFPAA